MSIALFDPGFSKILLSSFSYNIEILYMDLSRVKNFGQKKTQFILTFQKGKSLFDIYLSFYLGCMLWSACLKSMDSEKIEGNPFLDGEYQREQSLEEINYMRDFVKKFDRDSKYYLGKPYKVDENKLKILDLYEQFIDSNGGFVKVDTTDKIQLVGKLNELSEEEIKQIENKIQEVISSNKLEDLLIFCDKI